jgi:hypothetical protein
VISQLGESIFNAGTQSKAAPQLMKEAKCLKVGGTIFDKLQYCSTAFDEKDFRWASGNKDEEWSINDISKWAEILLHVLNPSSTCMYPDDRRLMTCAATLAAGMFSGSLAEFESRAAAFLFPYLSASKSQIDHSHIQALEDKVADGDPQLCEIEMAAPLINRRFIVTQKGYYGLAPPTAREGDSCCVIFGTKTPFIVRPVAGLPNHYKFIGEAYVHGMMKGEIVEMCVDGEFQEEDIILV